MKRGGVFLGWGLLVLSLVPWALAPWLIATLPMTPWTIVIGVAAVAIGELVGGLALILLGRETMASVRRRFTRKTQRNDSARRRTVLHPTASLRSALTPDPVQDASRTTGERTHAVPSDRPFFLNH